MDDVIEVIPIDGFDADGEPEIRGMADGGLVLVFNFMPPIWAEDEPERFDDFDRQISQAVGQPVQWEDREVFRIARPAADTVARLQKFLAEYKH